MMNRSLRFGTAVSALAMAGLVAGCATGQHKNVAEAAAPGQSKVGLATRAHLALSTGDFAKAVSLSEQAVQKSPSQALFRALLGNAYFAAGRFASAEAAFRDSLSLNPRQANVVLKLALAAVAQGKQPEAVAALEAGRETLDPADYGLALALAGHAPDAVAVLDQAARLPGADARTRQNLALAHALSGDWTMARAIAAQDVPPEQLDSRIQQWMAMATPARASDQVAALTGVKPSFDPGQPVYLALNKAPSAPRMAQAAPMPQPVQAAAPEPMPVAYSPPEPQYLEALPQPMAMPALPAAPEPQAPTIQQAVHAEALAPAGEQDLAQVLIPAAAQPQVPVEPMPARFEAKPVVAKLVAASARKPARARGKSSSVVQLGAYGSPARVEAAWNQFARRFGMLNRYTPVSMRFSSAEGTVYRLSVKGFASAGEAQQLCGALKQKGKNCFVRRVAGDAPVQFASR